MILQKTALQAFVAIVLFTIISVILTGEYGKEIWIEKGIRGFIFGAIYFVFLLLKEKFGKKK